jgi:molecular chaperone GrpE
VTSPPSQPDDAETPNSAQDVSSESANEARTDELISQQREAQSRYLRLAADFENFRKRARQEQLEAARYAAVRVAEQLLPVLDDAERAMERVPGIDEKWLRGVQLAFQRLREVLASTGVEPIEALGAPFDPKFHEAVGTEESSEYPEGTVIAELRRGYRIGDRVLRPSLVKLARRPTEDDTRLRSHPPG